MPVGAATERTQKLENEMTNIRRKTQADRDKQWEKLLKTDGPHIDRQINKDTGIWKRAQEQLGIPLPPETRQKISLALAGRKLTDETKAKISASLKAFHAARLT